MKTGNLVGLLRLKMNLRRDWSGHRDLNSRDLLPAIGTGVKWVVIQPAPADTRARMGDRRGWKSLTNVLLQAKNPLRNWPGQDEQERDELRLLTNRDTAFGRGCLHLRISPRIGQDRSIRSRSRRIAHEYGVSVYGGQSPSMPRAETSSLEHSRCAMHTCQACARSAEVMVTMAMEIAGVELPVGIRMEVTGIGLGRNVVPLLCPSEVQGQRDCEPQQPIRPKRLET